MSTTTYYKIKHRRDTYANWISANPVLGAGEMALVTDNNTVKIGDGSATFASCGYVGDAPGDIKMTGKSTAPVSWALCDNTAYSRTTYAALFAAIGTTYGSGDSSTTFNVPDCRGIFVRGAGTAGTMTTAGASAYSGILGTYENDKYQSHKHEIVSLDQPSIGAKRIAGYGAGGGIADGDCATNDGSRRQATTQVTDGVGGVPRVGTQTNPANVSLTYIIKL